MNSTSDTIEDAMKLNSMPDPAGSQNSVLVHRTWEDALRHLCDHLLTSPECNAWAVVAPDYSSILDPNDPDRRWEYAVRARESRGKTAQPLYDLYSVAVGRDALDARELCWHRSKGPVTVAVGTSGILIVIEDALRTAFLGGQGDPEATRMSRIQYERGQPLARERGMRSGRTRSFPRDGREEREKRRREASWSNAQRLYFRVFRPCIQFIKKSHHRGRDICGKPIGRDYALLKDLLPPRNQLAYEHWLELRRRCRGD